MSQDLLALIEEEKFSEALEFIKLNKNLTLDMVQAKIFCLINLGKLSLALSTIKIFEKRLNLESNVLAFEKAYCYYRVGKLTAARKILESDRHESRMVLLLAQVFYKSGDYLMALKYFEELYFEHAFDREQLEVNILACKSLIGQDHVSLEHLSVDSAYNMSLAKLTSNEIINAQRFAEKCIELLENDSGSDNDRINAEIVSICVCMIESRDNWPEANFILRKLKASKQLSPIQSVIIDANIIISSRETKDLAKDFKLSSLTKINLSEEQKNQILSNYYHSGAKIPGKELGKISIAPELVYEMKLKSDESKIKDAKNPNTRKSMKPLDKERWLPLRDRSYYLSKDKYLKQLKRSSAKKA